MTQYARPFVLSSLIIIAAFIFFTDRAYSTISGPLGGYAWSDNIGWVSFNCATGGPTGNNICATSNYFITMDNSGLFSGYAWSDNVGWISANQSDLTGCPSSPCWAKLDGNTVTGWMKALSASNGWDGWISLSGSNYGVTINSDGAFSGYAWGSDVVGWLSFSGVSPAYGVTMNAISCTIAPSPSTITSGQSSTLTWASNNASAGSISPTIGTVAASGSGSVSPTTTTTYTGTFTGAAGSGQCTATVTVQCAVTYSCSDAQHIVQRNAACATVPYATCTAPQFCSTGVATCVNPAPSFNQSGNLSGHLQARPPVVNQGASTRIHWDVSNVSGCTVTGTNGDSWTGTSSGNPGQTSAPLTQQTVYTINCTPLDGSTLQERVTVNVVPIFQEL